MAKQVDEKYQISSQAKALDEKYKVSETTAKVTEDLTAKGQELLDAAKKRDPTGAVATAESIGKSVWDAAGNLLASATGAVAATLAESKEDEQGAELNIDGEKPAE